ncbi:hypothetical protein DEU35_1349 [Microbacterium sp. AG157]|nr:hypothetical protein DEU35_1349 [Microbacterium sp. AG157]
MWATIIANPNEPEAPDLRTELTPLELANSVRRSFYKDRNYLRRRRSRWAAGAITIRMLALAFSWVATVLLGLSNLSGLAAWGFAFSALVTLITALEPFLNFRSRWVSADEALARWHRAEEELTSYVATTSEDKIAASEVLRFDEMRRDEWMRFSQDWLANRRSAASEPRF